MTSRFMLVALLLGLNATSVYGDAKIGAAMETCEKGAIVKDELGVIGRIISDVAGMCLVTIPSGTKGVIPGGSKMYLPGSLVRQAPLNEVAGTGVVAGSYLCTRASDQFQFYFELAGDGTYSLQESVGTYENSDRNSINFVDGELDGAFGWMNKGTIGLSVSNSQSEARCIVQ
jgi:hypothetical protein